jgi:hypothetical protein
MECRRKLLRTVVLILAFGAAAWAQDTASIIGTVIDSSGAAIPNAAAAVSNGQQGISRQVVTNGSGEYLFAGLPIGSYDITVTAPGFKKYEAKGVILRVAEKARVDVTMQVGDANVEVLVQGSEVARVETQSSDLGGTVSGKEISQLELNGRDFKRLITLVPGVSNQTGADEGGVGVTANNSFSVNGGRVEYNNWELDGGDVLDNGQNNTLNVTPSIDAIGEFKVLTSNYGAQYGKNGSGTIEVETKSGTKAFHGDAYEFVRNTALNAPAWGQGGVAAPYHKNDFGYTVGGPAYIPGVYNKDKNKTFFFFSEEWRRERVPYTFNQPVPTVAERGGNFSDICALGTADCPVQPQTINGVQNPNAGQPYSGNQVPLDPNDPNVQALLSLIPAPNFGQVDVPGLALFHQVNAQPTTWREELFKIDHNLNDKERLSFRYIHDSWNTLNETPLWTNAGSFPTIQTQFGGPGVSMVAHLSSAFSPTLLNEFVASYTTDHIVLNNIGDWKRPSNTTFGAIFPGADHGVMPGITLNDVAGVYTNFGEDAGYIPNGPYNSNPTYTFKDNISKLYGKHNLQFGALFQAVQKNELGSESAGSPNGFITFNPSSAAEITTGNPFSDLLLGNIASFGQQNQTAKYYNRYKILEPYFNDDWHITSRLTLNLGVRISLFGTYRERYHQAFNFVPTRYIQGQTKVDYASDVVSNLTVDGQPPAIGDLPNGIVQCGVTTGVPVGCMNGHLFNPAPRLGFAWDPKGDGKTAIRGGYGIFFEHGNGNEGNTNSLENSPPLAYASIQNNIVGYPNIGSGQAGQQFPLGVTAVPTQAKYAYVQQWHLDWQRDLVRNTVATVSYVGSKGTHLTRVSNLNQLRPVSASQNPYTAGEAISSANTDCSQLSVNGTTVSGITVNGNPVSGSLAQNVAIAACGANSDPFRPYPGYSNIQNLQPEASSSYNALQVAVRRSAGGLELNVAYTYNHSIDDSSDRSDASFTNAYDPAANRASSNFDERHVLNVGYVWDVPVFKSPGLAHKVLGGWQYSGITSFSTGSPFSVLFPTDNAGVANGIGSSSYADIVGDPKAGVVQNPANANLGRLFYNQSAYAAPTGLTFGDSGRNSLRNPDFINFDMALFKHFTIKESTAFEFRAEAFNVFNHTEWLPIGGQAGSFAGNNNSGNNTQGSSTFLYSGGVHQPRILQLALKFIF